MAQLLYLVDRTIEANSPGEQRVLNELLASEIFSNFAQKQLNASVNEESRIDPYKKDQDAQDFLQLARDARLRTRFWRDLLDLSEEMKQQVASTR